MKRLLISDLHLCENAPERTRAFIRLLQERAPQYDELLILGDLFDVWVGDDDDNPWLEEILQAMLRCCAAGVDLGVQYGNRDFLYGAAFTQRSGAKILPEYLQIEICGTAALLIHGDQLCTTDVEYQKARKQLRSKQWIDEFTALPLAQRKRIAAQYRARSRQTTGELALSDRNYILDADPDEAVRLMDLHQVPLLIHGHTHRPAVHQVDEHPGRRRMVLGDWNQKGWYIEASDTQCTLNNFDIE